MTARPVLVACLFLVFCAPLSRAESFLNPGPGAPALGLGGAFGAVADDPTAAHWNPARLAALPQIVQATGGWQPLSTTPLDGFWFGASSVRLEGLAVAGWGARQRRDAASETRQLWGAATAFSVGIAQLGFGFKQLELTTGGETAQGVGVDFGLGARLFDAFHVGFAMEDALNTTLTLEGGAVQAQFAPTIRAGGSVRVDSFAVSFEGAVSEAGFEGTRVGAEVRLINLFALRVGTDGPRWSWGLGVGTPQAFRLDVAYLIDPEGDAFVLSSTVGFDPLAF